MNRRFALARSTFSTLGSSVCYSSSSSAVGSAMMVNLGGELLVASFRAIKSAELADYKLTIEPRPINTRNSTSHTNTPCHFVPQLLT